MNHPRRSLVLAGLLLAISASARALPEAGAHARIPLVQAKSSARRSIGGGRRRWSGGKVLFVLGGLIAVMTYVVWPRKK
ncbi:hypothetical protein [Caldimonas brevitalea]|uniref:Uncharacterized protein n=1 Tax=Caldimonas brevitalea TaxID=413882 RepID=A0A0G3BS80_9BURK|nr:hypothetical protein [Caldimonas brevitalea]AKJ30848.1 hypothetical protein AAW51_4157 [Caldimonas brevitalea]